MLFRSAAGLSLDALIGEPGGTQDPGAVTYVVGLITLIWGLGSFVYFTFTELMLRGQTLGKRSLKIRVVKADGFQLDAASIFMRNAFRVLDQIPAMWIVPLVSRRSQRAGDIVAGTLVIHDEPAALSPIRTTMAERNAADAMFRFDQAALARATAADFAAVERMLERWDQLPADQRRTLERAYSTRLATKLQVPPPPPETSLRFLEDLLAAEFRRRDRMLK